MEHRAQIPKPGAQSPELRAWSPEPGFGAGNRKLEAGSEKRKPEAGSWKTEVSSGRPEARGLFSSVKLLSVTFLIFILAGAGSVRAGSWIREISILYYRFVGYMIAWFGQFFGFG